MINCSVDVSDFDNVLEFCQARFPTAQIFTIGFSMGANSLVKWLGSSQKAKLAGIKGAISVSNAFNYEKLVSSLSTPFNSLAYSRFLAWRIKSNVLYRARDSGIFDEITAIDWEGLDRVCFLILPILQLQASTIPQIDDSFTRRIFDIPSLSEYYSISSSSKYLQKVACPILCLNASDDPFKGEIPLKIAHSNENVVFAITVGACFFKLMK